MDARRCSWAAIPLRLALGFGMAYHGYPKLFSSSGHDQFVGMLGGIGVPSPDVMAWSVGGLEFIGGILLILGAFTRVLSALFIVEMLVAALLVHLPAGFSFMNITGMGEAGPEFGMPGYEVNVLYIAGFLALLISGAGRYSVDAAFRGRADEATIGGSGAQPRRGWREKRAAPWRNRSRNMPAQ